MKEARYFYVPSAEAANELPEQEAQHAIKVLRLTEGSDIFLMDGEGCFYEAEVTMASKKRCFYAIRKKLPQQKTWRGSIHLAIAPTKMMERMEWMVEKSVEIGVDEITFLDCQFSERHTLRTDRVEKIMVAAMKQSRTMSMVEATANVVVGYVLAIATQIVVFPWFGIETGLAEHLTIGLAFVGVSLLRGYLLRRLFEAIRMRSAQ